MSHSALKAYLSRLPREKTADHKLWVDDEQRVQGQYFNCALTSQFQPVRDLEGNLRAFDAYANSYSKADAGLSVWRMLNNAASDDESVELDRLCRMLHVINFFRQADSSNMSLLISVHERLLAAVTTDHGAVFRRILDSLEIPSERILLQLPQATPNQHWVLGIVAENYRCNGFKVATKAAHSDEATRHLDQFRPDLIRIDSHAFRNIDSLANVIEHADALGTTVLFSRADNQTDLLGVYDAIQGSGIALTKHLWTTGALFGQPRATLSVSHVVPAPKENNRLQSDEAANFRVSTRN
jgi:EAL domain-containing protein (putative c-di-GMP-specific phosphodiesterase class I)